MGKIYQVNLRKLNDTLGSYEQLCETSQDEEVVWNFLSNPNLLETYHLPKCVVPKDAKVSLGYLDFYRYCLIRQQLSDANLLEYP